MATTNIKRFAETDSGTNLLTNAEYDVDAERTIGHQPGVARSKFANKAMRQASCIVAGIGQWLADKQATNVNDGKTEAELSVMLSAAVAASVPVATTTTQGTVELATVSETGNIAVTDRAVTPVGLQQQLATTIVRGLIKTADVATAQAGTDTTRAVTPASLALDASQGANGYAKLPGGLIVQWGSHPDDQVNHSFPIPFPNAVFTIQGTCDQNDGPVYLFPGSLTLSQFSLREHTGIELDITIYWFAIGN